MQIDNNILTIVLAVTTVALTVLYFRSYLNSKFMQQQRVIDENAAEFYREMDSVSRRLFAVEKCCDKGSCKSERNHYNTTA